MIKLALASLRFRVAASLATLIGVLLGGSLLIACGGLFESGLRLDAPPQRLHGTPIVVTGSSGFRLPNQESQTVPYSERSGVDPSLVGRITATPGVERALPDVSFPAIVVASGQPVATGGTVLSGHDWTSAGLTPYTLRSGSEPGASGQVVLDAKAADIVGAKPGDAIDIAVDGQSRTFTVTGVAHAGTKVIASAIFFSTADVQRFSAHPHSVDSIGVFPGQGTTTDGLAQRLRRELPPGLSILTGDDRGTAEFTGIASSGFALIVLSSVFGGMVLVVMVLVVSATISLSVRQRQQELALLRATGATPKQVRRMVVAETMAVSVLAAIGAIALGKLTGNWIFSQSTERGVVPAELEFRQGIIPFTIGALLSLLIPWVTARFAALTAARTRPIQALAEAAIPPVAVGPTRWLLAKVFAGLTAALAVTTTFLSPDLASSTGGPAELTGAIAVGLIAPELIAVMATKTADVVRRIAGKTGALAVINTRSRAAQFASVLTPITVAIAIALGSVYGQTTQDAGALAGHLDQFQADAVLTSTAGGIAPGLLAQVRGTPGVAHASELVWSQGWIEKPYIAPPGNDYWSLLGIDAQDKASILAVPVTSGSLRDLSGNTVALPAAQAGKLGIKVGDQVTMRLGDGAQANVKVVALLNSPANYESVVLPAELLAPHTAAGLPSQILVRANSGQDSSTLVSAIKKQVQAWPGISVGDHSLLSSTFAAGLGFQAWINYLISVLAIAYAAIASVNTLAVAVLARRREFAVQRLVGGTRRQVMRMLFVEGGIVAVASIVLGTVISAFTVIPMAISVGLIVPSGPLWVFLAVILAVFVIVWPVTFVSAGVAMKRKPIEAVSLPNE